MSYELICRITVRFKKMLFLTSLISTVYSTFVFKLDIAIMVYYSICKKKIPTKKGALYRVVTITSATCYQWFIYRFNTLHTTIYVFQKVTTAALALSPPKCWSAYGLYNTNTWYSNDINGLFVNLRNIYIHKRVLQGVIKYLNPQRFIQDSYNSISYNILKRILSLLRLRPRTSLDRLQVGGLRVDDLRGIDHHHLH